MVYNNKGLFLISVIFSVYFSCMSLFWELDSQIQPNWAWPGRPRREEVVAIKCSVQGPVTSDPIPLANKTYVSLSEWVMYLPHREGHKHLGTRTEFATTIKCVEYCLTNRNPSTNMKIIHVNLWNGWIIVLASQRVWGEVIVPQGQNKLLNN